MRDMAVHQPATWLARGPDDVVPLAGADIHGVGLELLVRLGDTVKEGQLLGRLFAREGQRETVSKLVLNAIHIGQQDVQPGPLILNHIGPTTEN